MPKWYLYLSKTKYEKCGCAQQTLIIELKQTVLAKKSKLLYIITDAVLLRWQ